MSVYAVVIPAYNEVTTIRQVASGALEHLRFVIVVDDGSSDGTAAALDGLPITLLRNETNQGKAASLWRGVQTALAHGARGVITLDGDGQHLPEAIPRFIAVAEAYPGRIVIGARMHGRTKAPSARYYANKFANFWISWACGQRIADTQSGYRLYPAEVFTRLQVRHDRPRSFVFESEVLIEAARASIVTQALPVPAIYKPHGRPSHYRPTIDTLRIAAMVAWKLLSRGLYLPGLWRAFIRPKDSSGTLAS